MPSPYGDLKLATNAPLDEKFPNFTVLSSNFRISSNFDRCLPFRSIATAAVLGVQPR